MYPQIFRDYIRPKLLLKPIVNEDPRLLSNLKKNLIMFGVCWGVSIPGISSTVYFPGIPSIIDELHAPFIAITLTTALFILAVGIAPIFWASISDRYQIRRSILIIALLIFAISSLVCAFINEIWVIVVLRIIQSVGSSSCFCIGSGIIADIYPIEQRGAAFSKFFFAYFLGPLTGPIIGGALNLSSITWRANFLFCFAITIGLIIYLFILLPETYRVHDNFDTNTFDNKADKNSSFEESNVTLKPKNTQETEAETTRDQEKVQDSTSSSKNQTTNPLKVILLLRHPFVFLPSLIGGITFGCMFAIETIIPELFTAYYDFNSWQIGLSYLGCGIGNVLGAIFNGLVSDKLLLRSRKIRGGEELIEDRITLNIWPCVFIFIPLGLLAFGWGVEKRLSVFLPIVAFGVQSFGINQVMASISAYLVDSIPDQGASVNAAQGCVIETMAFILTLVANPLVNSIGPGMTCTILAICSAMQCIAMIIIKFKGEKLRKWSGY